MHYKCSTSHTPILDLSNGPAFDRLRELPRDILRDLLYSYFH